MHHALPQAGLGIIESNPVKRGFHRALIFAMPPFGVGVAQSLHVKQGRMRLHANMRARAIIRRQLKVKPGDTPRAIVIAHIQPEPVKMADSAGFQVLQHRAAVPRRAVAIIICVAKQNMVFKVYRRPQPVKLRHHFGNAALRVGVANGPDAPAPVARAVPIRDAMNAAAKPDLALPAHILRRACIIHKQARPIMAGKARLFDRRMASRGFDAGGNSVFRIIDADAHADEWLDNLDTHRPDHQVQPVAQHVFGGAQIMLLAIDHETEARIHNI